MGTRSDFGIYRQRPNSPIRPGVTTPNAKPPKSERVTSSEEARDPAACTSRCHLKVRTAKDTREEASAGRSHRPSISWSAENRDCAGTRQRTMATTPAEIATRIQGAMRKANHLLRSTLLTHERFQTGRVLIRSPQSLGDSNVS